MEGTEKLFNMREQGVKVSLLTRELLSYEDLQPQMEYFMQNSHRATGDFLHTNYITCLGKINKAVDEEKTV